MLTEAAWLERSALQYISAQRARAARRLSAPLGTCSISEFPRHTSTVTRTMAPAPTTEDQPAAPAPAKGGDTASDPKTDSVLTDKDREDLAFVDKYSSPDVYINSSKDTLWHPWVGTLELKPLRFETRTGTFVICLRTPVDCWLGKHRHRGTVTAVTTTGPWRYKEYVPTYMLISPALSRQEGRDAILKLTRCSPGTTGLPTRATMWLKTPALFTRCSWGPAPRCFSP